MTFGVDPDTHIDSLEHAKQATIDGTSKWSCSITLTGTDKKYRPKVNTNKTILKKAVPYNHFLIETPISLCTS